VYSSWPSLHSQTGCAQKILSDQTLGINIEEMHTGVTSKVVTRKLPHFDSTQILKFGSGWADLAKVTLTPLDTQDVDVLMLF
jgi:hypothetical protein